MRFKDFFEQVVVVERITGNTGWVFHRTRINPETNPSLWQNGIDPTVNQSAMYGQGLYATYSLNSQLKSGMSMYGPYIVRGKIDLSNFFIFDEKVFKLARPRDRYQDQFKKYQINYTAPHEEDDEVNPYTSDMAQKHWEKLKNQGVAGLIFNGRNDGNVVVIYDRHAFIPDSFSDNNGESWKHIKADIREIKRPKISSPKDYSSTELVNLLQQAASMFNKNGKVPDTLIDIFLGRHGYGMSEMLSWYVHANREVPAKIINVFETLPSMAPKGITVYFNNEKNPPEEFIKCVAKDLSATSIAITIYGIKRETVPDILWTTLYKTNDCGILLFVASTLLDSGVEVPKKLTENILDTAENIPNDQYEQSGAIRTIMALGADIPEALIDATANSANTVAVASIRLIRINKPIPEPYIKSITSMPSVFVRIYRDLLHAFPQYLFDRLLHNRSDAHRVATALANNGFWVADLFDHFKDDKILRFDQLKHAYMTSS